HAWRRVALFPGRELSHRRFRRGAGRGTGGGAEPVLDAALRIAAIAAVVPARRRAGAVAAWPARRAQPRTACIPGAAGGGDAERVMEGPGFGIGDSGFAKDGNCSSTALPNPQSPIPNPISEGDQ